MTNILPQTLKRKMGYRQCEKELKTRLDEILKAFCKRTNRKYLEWLVGLFNVILRWYLYQSYGYQISKTHNKSLREMVEMKIHVGTINYRSHPSFEGITRRNIRMKEACNKVLMEVLWGCLAARGVPVTYIRAIKYMYVKTRFKLEWSKETWSTFHLR
ncbi:hypothetical protein H5410_039734 [Solanum commersonii]|uniref:Uncharacterized protein n=1 Tax=Solanum commersonii TaxID=4109 RepID=A0A9J5XPE0_SOLCO|nr:hypothetical protein H5410_039734 [Solanum commersonii]